MNAQAKAEMIQTLKDGAAKQEAEILALPEGAYVIIWHDCALHTDGSKVSMFGPSVYWGSIRVQMVAEAEKWNRTAKDDSPAVCMSKAEALSHIRAKNAEMLAWATK